MDIQKTSQSVDFKEQKIRVIEAIKNTDQTFSQFVRSAVKQKCDEVLANQKSKK